MNAWYVSGAEISAAGAAVNQTDLVPYLMELTLELSDSFVQARMLPCFTVEAGYFTQHEIAKTHLVNDQLTSNHLTR